MFKKKRYIPTTESDLLDSAHGSRGFLLCFVTGLSRAAVCEQSTQTGCKSPLCRAWANGDADLLRRLPTPELAEDGK